MPIIECNLKGNNFNTDSFQLQKMAEQKKKTFRFFFSYRALFQLDGEREPVLITKLIAAICLRNRSLFFQNSIPVNEDVLAEMKLQFGTTQNIGLPI